MTRLAPQPEQVELLGQTIIRFVDSLPMSEATRYSTLLALVFSQRQGMIEAGLGADVALCEQLHEMALDELATENGTG